MDAADLERMRELLASRPDLSSLIDELAEKKMQQGRRGTTDEYRTRLVSLCESLLRQSSFASGQLVTWKKGLKNKRRPQYDEPVVVVEILDAPVLDEDQNPGSAYFREPLDLVVGMLDEDDDFVLYHVDSRRFEHIQASATPPE